MSHGQEVADLAKRVVELEKELIKARLDASGQKGLSAKLEKNAKHWAKRLDKAETQLADWKRVAGELAKCLKLRLETDWTSPEDYAALVAFEAIEKGEG